MVGDEEVAFFGKQGCIIICNIVVYLKETSVGSFYYLKKLNTAFLNMAEDINFDYNPEICDAMMKFLNETTYGIAAAEAVVSFGKEGNRTQKMSVIRKIKEVPEGTEIADVEGELNTVFIFMHMIHAHEDALKSYLTVIEEIDNETQVRRKKLL